MNEFLKNLQRQASENPVVALGVAAAFLQSVAKVGNTRVAQKNAKTYKKEVDRRVKKSK